MGAPCAPSSRAGSDCCPGSLTLHKAEDGFLARVRVPGGILERGQVDAIARAAALGNGLVDLTSRANLQIRGLPAGAARLAELLHDVGLMRSAAHDRVRNVMASPVAGRHPTATTRTDAEVAAMDAALCADGRLAELPGRFMFSVDDGSGIALTPVADIAILADHRLALDGRPTSDLVADPVATAIAAAHAFLDLRTSEWRIAELPGGAATVAERLGLTLEDERVEAMAPLGPGRLEQLDGGVALTALAPLGQLEAEQLAALGRPVRLGVARTLTVIDVKPCDATAVQHELASIGFVLNPDSGWAGLSACAGLGRCPRAELDARGRAAARAAQRRRQDPAEHWVACERRCGVHPGQAVMGWS